MDADIEYFFHLWSSVPTGSLITLAIVMPCHVYCLLLLHGQYCLLICYKTHNTTYTP